ncbi:hypothetical protein F4780DRAFT_424998 [Xylariomycetidae sp. FL0641]|nr:hypothetical protein F4780DRAFT_424998 [Xylariomycetidae sp. FL0641]
MDECIESQRTFRPFSQLAPELRLQIWSFHALPRVPALFIPRLGALEWHTALSYSDLQVVRACMQVNREARACVLSGHEIRCVSNLPQRSTRRSPSLYQMIRLATPDIPTVPARQSGPTVSYCFVDWEMDVFYLSPMGPIEREECNARNWEKVRNLALNVRDLPVRLTSVHGNIGGFKFGNWEPWGRALAKMPMLQRVTIVAELCFASINEALYPHRMPPLQNVLSDQCITDALGFHIATTPEQVCTCLARKVPPGTSELRRVWQAYRGVIPYLSNTHAISWIAYSRLLEEAAIELLCHRAHLPLDIRVVARP